MDKVTRREVLGTWAAGAALVALGDAESALGRSTRRRVRKGRVGPFSHGTTLDGTVLRGPVLNGQGYRRLMYGAGEPWDVRDDLGTKPAKGRAARRVALTSFVQFTDTHILDAQSPGRVEWTDRYNDGVGSALIFSSAYRPHEMLTAHVTESLVRRVNKVGKGPATGRRFDFTICTGDVVDNCQHNELRWVIDLLDGARVRPDSGDVTRYEGVADGDALSYDTHYWHPDGAPDGKPLDLAHTQYGFPTIRGLLDAARRPFDAQGLKMPWYTAYGNHDGLVQGNFPQSFRLSALTTGAVKIVTPPAGLSLQDLLAGKPSALAALLSAPARRVTPDPDRRVVSRAQTVAEYFRTTGTPVGHGFTAANKRDGTAYYTFTMGPHVRGIVLDTVNPNGEADGSIDPDQHAWLKRQLDAARDKIVVVFSHHTIDTMGNALVALDDPRPRVLGDAVRDTLWAHRNVVAWVNGHTHVNKVTPRRKPGGTGGFWEISTAAHIDFPSQARLVEIADNRDGTLSIFGTIVDAAAPLVPTGRTDDPVALASIARELAVNDWQERPAAAGTAGSPDGRRGRRDDRNVELLVAAPFRLPAPRRRTRATAGAAA